MPVEGRPRSPFDEQAALQELERLHRAIEETRRLRKEKVAEFDDFVRSFEGDAPSRGRPVEASVQKPAPHAVGRAVEEIPTAPRAVAPEAAPAVMVAAPPPAPVPVAATVSAPAPEVPPLFDDRPSSPRKRPAWVVPAVAVGALAIAGGVLLTRSSRTGPDDGTRTSASPPAPAPRGESAPAAPGAGAAAAAPAAVASGIVAELTTTRPAWVRVTIDGQRALERELPAGSRIPLRAQHTIAIRAGDAGAVRMAIGGQDQGVLGRDGIPVNRTFSAKTPR